MAYRYYHQAGWGKVVAVGTFTLATQSKPLSSILMMRKIRVILGVGAGHEWVVVV